MSYEPTTWKTGDVLNATALNKIQNGISEIDNTVTTLASTTVSNLASTVEAIASTVTNLASLVDEYDLVLTGPYDSLVSNITLLHGDILEAEAKLAEGKPVKGVFIVKEEWSYISSYPNTNRHSIFLPLTDFHGPYTYLSFSGLVYSQNNLTSKGVSLTYDPEDGSFTSVSWWTN